ncbi:MAG: hypothetical protein ACE37F_23695 [Nannocystaceae bacterium]|nr:hypothetical protein [bacterium]
MVVRLPVAAAPLLLASACGPSVVTGTADTETATTSTGAPEEDTEESPPGATTSTGSSSGTASPEVTTSSSASSSETTTGVFDVVELRIEPAYAILDSAVGGQQREFTAIAITEDGDEVDVTETARWSLEGVGSVDAGVLTTPRSASPIFERTQLTASFGDEEARAFAAVSVRTLEPNAPQLFNLGIELVPRQFDFRPVIEKLDVFFLVDSVSYLGESFFANYRDQILDEIVPPLLDQGLDVQFGTGRYSAFPLEGAGYESCGPGQGDQPFELWSEVSPNLADFEAVLAQAVLDAPFGCFYDRGSFGEALYLAATGEGHDGPGATYVEPNPGPRGGVGFREDSLAVIYSVPVDYVMTGVEFLGEHTGLAAEVDHSPQEVVTALQAAGILHMGRTSALGTTTGPLRALMELAWDTGARVHPAAWNHPSLGRPGNCEATECCVDDTDGAPLEFYDDCLLASTYGSTALNGNQLERDFYALTHGLLTDVPLNEVGEEASIAGTPLPDGTTTADFLDIVPTGADDPPLDGAPIPELDGTTYRDVVVNTNLNYLVTVDTEAVPAVPDEPLLYRVTVHLDTDYREGSVVQEYWIVSPPLSE